MSNIKVDQELVRKVADLAQLSLSEPEVALYEARLSKILSYMQQLNEVQDSLEAGWRPDTSRGRKESKPAERNDEVKESLPVEESLSQAPARSGSAFQVPRIIE